MKNVLFYCCVALLISCGGGGSSSDSPTDATDTTDTNVILDTPVALALSISGAVFKSGVQAAGVDVCYEEECSSTDGDGNFSLEIPDDSEAPYFLEAKLSPTQTLKAVSYGRNISINELSDAVTRAYILNNHNLDQEDILARTKEGLDLVFPGGVGDPIDKFDRTGNTDITYRLLQYFDISVEDENLVVRKKNGSAIISKNSLFNIANKVIYEPVSGEDYSDQIGATRKVFGARTGSIRAPSFVYSTRSRIKYNGGDFQVFWDVVPDADKYTLYRNITGTPNGTYDTNQLVKTFFKSDMPNPNSILWHEHRDSQDNFPSNVRFPHMKIRYSVVAEKRVDGVSYRSSETFDRRWFKFGALTDIVVSNNLNGGIKISFDPVDGASNYYLYMADLRIPDNPNFGGVAFDNFSNDSRVTFKEENGKLEFFFKTGPSHWDWGFFVLSDVGGFSAPNLLYALKEYAISGRAGDEASAATISLGNNELVFGNLYSFYTYKVYHQKGFGAGWNFAYSLGGQGTVRSRLPGARGHESQAMVETTLADGSVVSSSPVTYTPALSVPGFSASDQMNRTVKITWDPIPRVSLYKLYQNGNHIADIPARNWQMSYWDSDLRPGSTYNYTLRVVSADGTSGSSNPVIGETILIANPAPPPGGNITAVSKGLDGKVELLISLPNNNMNYEIFRSNSQNGSYAPISVTNIGSQLLADTNVVAGQEYFYKISTYIFGDTGNKVSSAQRGPVSGYVLNNSLNPSLSAPSITKEEFSNEVILSFSENTSADTYIVTKGSETFETSIPYFRDTNPGADVSYSVHSLSRDGKSPTASIVASRKAEATRVRASDWRNYLIFVGWDVVAGAKAYDLYMSNTKNGIFRKLRRVFPEDASDSRVLYEDRIGYAVERYYYVKAVMINDNIGDPSETVRGRSLLPPPVVPPDGGTSGNSGIGSGGSRDSYGGTSNVTAGSGKAGETTIYGLNIGSCSVTSLSVKYRFDHFIGEPMKTFIMKWETSGDVSCLNNVTIKLKITGAGGSVGYVNAYPLMVKANGGYTGFDVPASPSWSKHFARSDGSYLSAVESKALNKSITFVEIVDVK